MKAILNISFHLFLITWHAYFSAVQIDDLIDGNLTGKLLIFFLLRLAIVVFFSISLWKMTRRKNSYEDNSLALQSTK